MAYDPKDWFSNPPEDTKTLRDKFAMAAFSHPIVANVMTPRTAATRAYVVADAMLKARLEFLENE